MQKPDQIELLVIGISKGFNLGIEWLRSGVGTSLMKEVKDTGVSQAERQIERRLFFKPRTITVGIDP